MGKNSSSKGEKPLTIKSPFKKKIKFFDSEKDSDVQFVVPDLDKTLHLQSALLKQASTLMETLFSTKQCPYGVYNEGAQCIEWTFEKAATDAGYQSALFKWLCFCYGEEQVFTINDFSAALFILLQLQIKCKDDLVKKMMDHFVVIVDGSIELGNRLSRSFGDLCGNTDDRRMISMHEKMISLLNEYAIKKYELVILKGSSVAGL